MTGTSVTLAATGHDLFFTHAVLWGAGAIAGQTHPDVRLGWEGGLTKVGVLYGISADDLAVAVHTHAAAATREDHWVQAPLPHERKRGLFSPRVKALPEGAWPDLASAREQHVDALSLQGDLLDLRLIAALGEPSSWHEDKGKPRQDRGASRLEMQPRNQGSEFVGTRLRPLAAAVTARSASDLRAGLTGTVRIDEAGKGSPDSRSAANLMPPRVTDNVLAWLAMWGLSSTTVAHRTRVAYGATEPSRSAAHLERRRGDGLGDEVGAGHLVAPLWSGRWTAARLRAVLGSAQLAAAGRAQLGETADAEASTWLRERGAVGVLVFPVHTYGSVSSPERRAMAASGLELLT